jgi:hypothetical protein
MSRGLGATQRAILALIDNAPAGAWSTTELCNSIYGGAEKKYRVAVARALRTVALPDGWVPYPLNRHGCEYCLYNVRSFDSVARKIFLEIDEEPDRQRLFYADERGELRIIWIKRPRQGFEDWKKSAADHVKAEIDVWAKVLKSTSPT